MSSTRVVIVSNGSLLTSGVAQLLGASDGVELLSVRDDGAALYDGVRAFRPDVIVAESGGVDGSSAVNVERLLRENALARVIAVGLEGTEMEVYRSERVEHASPADLLAIIALRQP